MNHKRGQSLIEVVVALGILAIVFAGTMTLVVKVINLELSAKKRTEGISLSQGLMAETISSIRGGCGVTTTFTPPVDPVNGDDFDYTVTVSDSPLGEFPAADFVEIKVATDWQNRGLPPESYELKQMVRKK